MSKDGDQEGSGGRLSLVQDAMVQQPHPAQDLEEVRRIAESGGFNRWTLFAAVAVVEHHLIGMRNRSVSKERTLLSTSYARARKLCEEILAGHATPSPAEVQQMMFELETVLRSAASDETTPLSRQS